MNNVLFEQEYSARFAGSVLLISSLPNSLRCGLEEFRQLRWLGFFGISLPAL